MMCTNAIVIDDVVSIVKVWCWIHRPNTHSIDMQLVLQIINLLMNSFITNNTQTMQLIS